MPAHQAEGIDVAQVKNLSSLASLEMAVYSCNPTRWLCMHVYLFLFVLLLYVPVKSYGHVGTVSSLNLSIVLGKHEQAVNQYFLHILLLVTDNNPS